MFQAQWSILLSWMIIAPGGGLLPNHRSNQSGTKPNLVAKFWLPTLVYFCNTCNVFQNMFNVGLIVMWQSIVGERFPTNVIWALKNLEGFSRNFGSFSRKLTWKAGTNWLFKYELQRVHWSAPHHYANPVYGVATICHQVRWLCWGHLSLFHTATSLLIWYKMFCLRDISYRLIWME